MKQKMVLTVCVLAVSGSVAAYAAPGPNVVRPYDGTGTLLDIERPVDGSSTGNRAVPDLQLAADHIVGQQCGDGGYGWPHADCSATYNNITGPISLGILAAHTFTGDPSHEAAAVAGGDFDLTFQYGNGEARFGGFAPHFLWQLSMVSGDNQYMNHAATGFFGELDAATYGPSDLDTAAWIGAVQAARTGTWVNLRPWEFHTLIHTATAIGNPGQDALFLQALLDGINTLDNTDPFSIYSDLIGLSGGVRGLALSGTTTFPAINSPNHPLINGIDNLEDLANALLAQQNSNGSWYWHSNLPSPGSSDQDTQTTAYAVMALVAADPLVTADYSSAVRSGSLWLTAMGLASGGFQSYPGGGENTEVEGEALSAIVAAGAPTVPTMSEWGILMLTLVGMTAGTLAFSHSRRAAVSN